MDEKKMQKKEEETVALILMLVRTDFCRVLDNKVSHVYASFQELKDSFERPSKKL